MIIVEDLHQNKENRNMNNLYNNLKLHVLWLLWKNIRIVKYKIYIQKCIIML